MTDEQQTEPAQGSTSVVVERDISAPAAQIFAVLADPRLHPGADGMGIVVSSEDGPITAAGQRFTTQMHHESQGGDYTMENTVTAFEQDREIGWAPGRPGEAPGGWTWTWKLEPLDVGTTRARLTYDWSGASEEAKAQVPFPPFPREAFEASLAKLAETVEGAQPGGMQSIVTPGAAPGAATTLAGNVAAADVTAPREFDSSAEGRRR